MLEGNAIASKHLRFRSSFRIQTGCCGRKENSRGRKSEIRNSGEANDTAYAGTLAWQANPNRLEAEVAKMV
jgi:hypothetical protein